MQTYPSLYPKTLPITFLHLFIGVGGGKKMAAEMLFKPSGFEKEAT